MNKFNKNKAILLNNLGIRYSDTEKELIKTSRKFYVYKSQKDFIISNEHSELSENIDDSELIYLNAGEVLIWLKYLLTCSEINSRELIELIQKLENLLH